MKVYIFIVFLGSSFSLRAMVNGETKPVAQSDTISNTPAKRPPTFGEQLEDMRKKAELFRYAIIDGKFEQFENMLEDKTIDVPHMCMRVSGLPSLLEYAVITLCLLEDGEPDKKAARVKIVERLLDYPFDMNHIFMIVVGVPRTKARILDFLEVYGYEELAQRARKKGARLIIERDDFLNERERKELDCLLSEMGSKKAQRT